VLRIIGSRLLQMIPVLFGVTVVAFILVNVLPGNLLYSILGANYSKQAAAVLSQQLHLNEPLIVRYYQWVFNALHGDLGTSLTTHASVAGLIRAAAPPTIELVIVSQIIAIFLGLAFSVLAVASPTVWVDRFATGFSLFGNSIPAFVVALLALIVFSQHWHLVSSIGWISPSVGGWGSNIRAIILPALTLAISIFPGYMRIFRREMQDQLESEEYVTLARMKNIKQSRIIMRHVARNSSLGVITLIGLSTGLLIGGAVIIEQIFAIPGIGTLIYTGIQQRDSSTVLGCIIVIAAAIVVLNMLADLVYAFLDPRVRANAS
jgi:peptide/nickel transport system permease protein